MLYSYHVFRLLLIALIITYFIACIFLFVSENFNNETDKQNENTFYQAFGLTEDSGWSESQRLVKILYFALTTLSTVGYGDIYPVSYIEMFIAVLIMFAGVAFFSYIMSNLMEIFQSIEAKMGLNDNSGELKEWIVMLLRYTNKTPLEKDLLEALEKDFAYFWANDRANVLLGTGSTENPFDVPRLPDLIKKEIIQEYLFNDIIFQN